MTDQPSHEDFGKLYTIPEAQDALRCSSSTIYKLGREGKLELVHIGRRKTRVTGRSLNALIKGGIKGNAA